MTEITQELIRNVLDTRYEAFSDENIQDAKDQILDLVAVTVSGADAPGNAALLDLIRQWGGRGEATIFVHGDKVPLPYAAMMNSIQCRSYDHEAVGPYPFGQNEGKFPGHVESTTVPCALSVGEFVGASGKDLLSAVILGGDLAARIAITEELSFAHPFDPVGTANSFGAVGITGRLMGLDETQMMNALGIQGTQAAGGFRSLWDGVMTFKFYGGTAARNGIMSALLAKKDFTGLHDPLFGPQGYYACYTPSHRPELMNRDLGKEFYTKAMHKKYPSCYGNHGIIECALEIVEKYDIDADEISEIIIGMHPDRMHGFGNQPFKPGDSQQKALFNQHYAAANVLLRKGARLEHFTEEAVKDPKVVELAGKVKAMPSRQENGKLELIAKMKDGKEYSAVFQKPQNRGYPKWPLTREELIEKYWNNINFCNRISKSNAEKALSMIENLEEVDNISDLIKLLVA
ncbi:MmgE/PrpD family protein [Thermodesulfobacteriota bacterium]